MPAIACQVKLFQHIGKTGGRLHLRTFGLVFDNLHVMLQSRQNILQQCHQLLRCLLSRSIGLGQLGVGPVCTCNTS